MSAGSPMLWNADYSQLELRIFAYVTKCRWMVDTFQQDGDIHAATGQIVLGISPAELKANPSMRTRAKTLNFGMAYGAQGETVEEQIIKTALQRPDLNIKIPSLAECKEMVKTFWTKAPEAKEWVIFIQELVRDRGYSETLYGRRRYLPFIRSNNSELRAHAERQAVNHVIQGSAADIIKNAALMLWRDCDEYDADIRLQVHDELMGICWNPAKAQLWLEVVKRYMELDQPLQPVPLKVEPRLVRNWYEAK